jgi:predicted permease
MKKTFRFSDARPDPAEDARDEIGFHLEMRTRELIAKGMTPEEARRAALASFGDVPMVEAELRSARAAGAERKSRAEYWGSLVRDIRVALRGFRRRPLYAASVIAALGLGIGAAGAVFALVNGVLLRPLPYRAPDRLAMIWLEAPPNQGRESWPVSAGLYQEFRRTRSFTAVAALRSWGAALGDQTEVEQLRGARVTPSLFPTLGVAPLLGRGFAESEGEGIGAQVAIVSYAFWQSHLGADPGALGRSLTLNGQRYQIVGVMPPDFGFPRGAELLRGLVFGPRTDVWVPLAFSPEERQSYGTMNLAVVGRLAPNVTAAAGQDELKNLVRTTFTRLGSRLEIGAQVVTLREQAAKPVRRGLLILLAAVSAVLLIACANVAGLLSARVADRRRELAVRLALGARRPRVARQLVTETLVLAAAGGLIGAGVAWWGTRLLLTLAPGDLPRADDVGFGVAVLVAIAAVSILSGLAFGIIAVSRLAVASPAEALQGGAGRQTPTAGARLGRRVLVTGQVAVSVLLLIGAGLLLRSFVRIGQVRPGFEASGAVSGEIALPVLQVADAKAQADGWNRVFETLLERVGRLPGVTAAGGVSALPLTGAAEGGAFSIIGREPARVEDSPRTEFLITAGDYFKAAGIELASGRFFDARDRADASRVVIISRSLALKHFGKDDPVGQEVRCLFEFGSAPAPRRIVGVVADVKLGGLDADDRPTMYVPESQLPYPTLTIVARGPGDAPAMVAGIRRELKAIDPTVALSDVRTLDQVLTASLARQRFTLTLIASFAAAALLLAVLGLYGVIALSVQARRRELGVRLALGARPGALVRLVVGEGMRLVVVGVALGLVGAAAVAGALRALLYGVGARDLLVYATSATAVGAVALVATWIPARAAVRSSPTDALKTD